MKKSLFAVLLLLLSSFAAAAQESSPDSTESRFFVGMSISNTTYPIMGEYKYGYFGEIMPIANAYYGYRLSKRATIQLGIGYGANKINSGSLRYISADSIYDVHNSQNIQGIALPITFKFTPFNPRKRLQLYVNASIAPVFGHIEEKATETLEDVTTVLYDDQLSTFDLVATAGLTLNYSISKRLDVYADVILFYKNFYYDRPFRRYYEGKSAGVGVNYRLR